MQNMLRYVCVRIVAATCLGLLSSVSLLAQAPPVGDTFVSSSSPTTNYGPSITLIVAPGSTSYVQFNLSGIPAGGTVSKAMLRLYVDGVVKSGSFDVYQINSGWSENKLTYNTPAPPLGASATGGNPISISAGSLNQFVLIDITPLVQSWVNGSVANNGVALALTSGSSGYFSFDSKESLLTANGPQLLIALNNPGAQGPPGPQGPAGPQGPQGIQGPEGAQGPQGVKGDPGATGPQGVKGDTGATGPQGAKGDMGPQGVKGDTGAQGPQGIQGLQGPQGDPGAAGPAGKDGIGFNFRNAFNNSPSYAVNDVVSYNGSSYVALAATNPGDPSPDVNPDWSLIAQQGAAGSQGPKGDKGDTGPQGAQGTAGPQGAVGPQGVKGDTGAQGPQGIQGPIGLPGPQGSQGDAGPQGPAGKDGIGFNFRNAFDNSASYVLNDVVSYNGSSYVAIAANQGPNNPTPDQNSSAWSVIARQGAAGAQGSTGPQGAQGNTGAMG